MSLGMAEVVAAGALSSPWGTKPLVVAGGAAGGSYDNGGGYGGCGYFADGSSGGEGSLALKSSSIVLASIERMTIRASRISGDSLNHARFCLIKKFEGWQARRDRLLDV